MCHASVVLLHERSDNLQLPKFHCWPCQRFGKTWINSHIIHLFKIHPPKLRELFSGGSLSNQIAINILNSGGGVRAWYHWDLFWHLGHVHLRCTRKVLKITVCCEIRVYKSAFNHISIKGFVWTRCKSLSRSVGTSDCLVINNNRKTDSDLPLQVRKLLSAITLTAGMGCGALCTWRNRKWDWGQS